MRINPEATISVGSVSKDMEDGPGTRFHLSKHPQQTMQYPFLEAWKQDISEDQTCPFCRHHANQHGMICTDPHYYREPNYFELLGNTTPRNWPSDPKRPALSPRVVLEVLDYRPTVYLLDCRQCAREKDTHQAICLHLDFDYGSIKLNKW